MSLVGQRVTMWSVVILLLLIGVFLQTGSRQTPWEPAPGKLSITLDRF
jgi:hypothetical protein